VFVTNFNLDWLTIVDGITLGTTQVAGLGGFAIGVNPAENKVYISRGGGIGIPFEIYDRDTGVTNLVEAGNDVSKPFIYNPTSNRMYTSSEGNATSTILEGASDAFFNLPMFSSTDEPAVRYSTNHIYYSSQQFIHVLDDATQVLEHIPVNNPTPSGSPAQAVAINQTTGRVYVINDGNALNFVTVVQDEDRLTRPPVHLGSVGSAKLHVMDPATRQIVDTRLLIGFLDDHAMTTRPGGGRLYMPGVSFVTEEFHIYAGVGNNSFLTKFSVGGNNSRAVAFKPDGSRYYVTNSGTDNVSVMEASNNTLVTTIPAGDMAWGIAVSPDGAKAYVANNGSGLGGNSVSVINTTANTVANTISVGAAPYGVAINPNGTKLFVANSNAGTVSVIELSLETVIATVTVGTTPHWLACTPDGKRVYVGNRGSGTVSIIDTGTNAVIQTLTGFTNPEGIGVLPDNNEVFVVNSVVSGISSVTVINNNDFSMTNFPLPSDAIETISLAIEDPSAKFAGRVTSGGSPISGGLVRALQGGVEKGTATTNASGEYSIFNLKPGTYDIEAGASGYITQTLSGQSVSAGRITLANFNLTPVSLSSLSINDMTVTEGNTGTVNAIFTVSLSAASSQQITVDYATANGTATGGSDYVAIPATQLIFPPNTTTQIVTVIVNGDLFDESDENFFVNLTNPTNATIADAQGIGTITDDDSPSQTITLNPTDDAYVNANQPTSNFGTATTLRMKQSTPVINSYLKFTVSGVTGQIQSAKIRMTVTVASSSGGSVYSVSNNYLGTSTPWIETGLNYNNAPTVSGTPWDTEGSVTVGQIVELDVTPAITGNGTFSFGLKNSSTTTVQYSSEEGATKPQLVIQTGATFPSLSINDVTVTEGNVGNVNATFTVSLSAPSSQVVTVSYSTADGTAAAGSDYVSASGIVSFPIGITTQPVTISVIGDAATESNETFFVNLSNSTNATIADAQGQGTINDDDAVTITLNPTDDAYVNANQPTSNFGTATTLRMKLSSPIINSYLKFVVSGVSGTVLSAKLRIKVTVASSSGGSVYSVSNNYLGTSTPWIETGLNYNNAPTVSGTPWDTEGSVTVGQIVELDVTPAITGNGTFSFGLKNSSTTTVQYSSEEGATKPELVIQTAAGTPSLSINDVTVLEGNSGTVNASFTVSLSAPSSQIVSVSFATANGTATAGSDYVAASGTATFPIGVTTQPVTVAVNGDVVTESNEAFFVNLSNPTNATLADAQGIGTITDDDAVTITLNPTDDAFVRSDQTTTNFGTQTTLRMRQSSPILNSYLKFTVSGVTGAVLSAKLRMTVTVASSSGGSVYAVSNNYQGTSNPWIETGVNYSNAPIISGTPLDTEGSVTVGQVVEFEVTSSITGNGTFSFGLNNASTTTVQYSSKEGATKPELVIQFGASAAAKTSDLQSSSVEAKNVELTAALPERFALSPNYPNPFNAQTVIEYALPEAVNVRLVIFNVLGQRVRQLVDETQPAGYKRVLWDGKNAYGNEAGSGVYFLQLDLGRQRFVRKMLFQR